MGKDKGQGYNIGQNGIISTGGQDTSACHILGHYFNVFSLSCVYTGRNRQRDSCAAKIET